MAIDSYDNQCVLR